MKIDEIITEINNVLAGEMLTYTELRPFMNAVIDDINSTLDTVYPVFPRLNDAEGWRNFLPNREYDYFPDRYIRTVLIIGAAYKFYIVDEEGLPTAQQLGYDYQDGLFKMLRDYLEWIDPQFMAHNTGSTHHLWDVAFKPAWIGDYGVPCRPHAHGHFGHTSWESCML